MHITWVMRRWFNHFMNEWVPSLRCCLYVFQAPNRNLRPWNIEISRKGREINITNVCVRKFIYPPAIIPAFSKYVFTNGAGSMPSPKPKVCRSSSCLSSVMVGTTWLKYCIPQSQKSTSAYKCIHIVHRFVGQRNIRMSVHQVVPISVSSRLGLSKTESAGVNCYM